MPSQPGKIALGRHGSVFSLRKEAARISKEGPVISYPQKRLDTAFKAAQTTFQGRSAPFRHVPCYNSIQ